MIFPSMRVSVSSTSHTSILAFSLKYLKTRCYVRDNLQQAWSSSSISCESQREASLLNYYYGSEAPHYVFAHLVQHILLLLNKSHYSPTAMIILSRAISLAYSTVFNSSCSFSAIIRASAFWSFTSNSIFSFSHS